MENKYKEKISLDASSAEPLYKQLAGAVYEMMLDGTTAKDEKMPSVRELAAMLGINNGTAAAAYRLLEERRAVYKVKGSGTYCAGTDTAEKSVKSIVKQKCPGYADAAIKADFTKTSVSDKLFPVAKFGDIFNSVLERDKGEAFSYQPSAGYEPLRKSIAALLEEKSIKTTADRVQIISGSQQGIDLVARAILSEGDVVICEKFTYLGAVNAMLAQGAEVVYVQTDSAGIVIDEDLIKSRRPRLVYLMSCFQTPTGASMSTERKRRILELAYKYGFYIIEEDNVGDFNYSSAKAVPLKALDYKNRVIYIKSFSKILMPGLRLGYMVLPRAISEIIAGLKHSTDISTSGFIQRAFDLFMQGKGWQHHKAEMAGVFAQKYRLALALAKKHLERYFEISEPEGGLILWLRLKDGNTDAKKLCREFLDNGAAVISGGFYTADEADVPYIALSFADITDDDMKKGFMIMEKVCGDCLFIQKI